MRHEGCHSVTQRSMDQRTKPSVLLALLAATFLLFVVLAL